MLASLENLSKLTDKAAIFGLVGSKIQKSLSPLIHQAGADLAGTAIHYKLFECSKENLPDFLRQAYEMF